MEVGISVYILAPGIAWLTAQLAKYVIVSFKTRSTSAVRQLYLSGNMPSAHSATVVALATVIGLGEGLNSAVFAIALLFAFVVIYDSLMVRRSSGEQGAILVQMLESMKSKLLPPRVAKGHTPLEVIVGIALGMGVAFVVYFATINPA